MRDVRVALVGDEGVGKSSIISSLIKCVAPTPGPAWTAGRAVPVRSYLPRNARADSSLARSPPTSPHLRTLRTLPRSPAGKPLSASHRAPSSQRSPSRPPSPPATTSRPSSSTLRVRRPSARSDGSLSLSPGWRSTDRTKRPIAQHDQKTAATSSTRSARPMSSPSSVRRLPFRGCPLRTLADLFAPRPVSSASHRGRRRRQPQLVRPRSDVLASDDPISRRQRPRHPHRQQDRPARRAGDQPSARRWCVLLSRGPPRLWVREEAWLT